MINRRIVSIAIAALLLSGTGFFVGRATVPTQGPSPGANAEAGALHHQAVSGSRSVDRAPAVPAAQPGEHTGSAPVSFRGVAQEVLPVVVEINTIEVIRQTIPRTQSPLDFFFGPRTPQQPQQPQEREFRRPGLGSGVIVRRQGDTVYVLTNNHVVGDAGEISLRLYDGREFAAEKVGSDPRTDLALVQFQTADEVPIAQLGDSDSLYVGDWVLAVGNPFGFESTVTAGIISAVGRRPQPGSPIAGFTDFIQTDASINPGNSGGALADMEGNIVGINTWIASRTGGSVGLGFAIPINIARRAIDDFIDVGQVVYGWLGVSIGDVGPMPGLDEDLGIAGRRGALVMSVHRSSPAARDGIRPGDFVVQIDNTTITDATQMTRVVGNLAPGRRVAFRLIRDGSERTVTVTLERRGTEAQIADGSQVWPGMTAVPLTDSLRQARDIDATVEGLLVVNVVPESPAAIAGLRSGDVLTQLGDDSVQTAREFYRRLAAARREILFRVNRQGTRVVAGMDAL